MALVVGACSAAPKAGLEGSRPPAPRASAAPAAAASFAAPAAPSSTSSPAPTAVAYLKGQTHVHTNRSYDAHTPPDKVLEFYAERGYDFLVVTDHNRVTDAGPGPRGMLTFPGIEVTQNSTICEPKPSPGYRCLFHASGLFVDPARDRARGERMTLAFRPGRFDAYQSELSLVDGLGGVGVLNHPLFHFAADARLLGALAAQGLRHVELWNASLDRQHPGGREDAERRAEELWDQALSNDVRIFAMATDDAHHFADAADRARVGKFAYVGDRAWVMVRAEKNPAAIRAALERGDYYSSTGVRLTRVERARGTLVIEVAPETRGSRIRIVGRGGRELQRLSGTSASYALGPNDGYARGVVEDDSGKRAWTQPVFPDGS